MEKSEIRIAIKEIAGSIDATKAKNSSCSYLASVSLPEPSPFRIVCPHRVTVGPGCD